MIATVWTSAATFHLSLLDNEVVLHLSSIRPRLFYNVSVDAVYQCLREATHVKLLSPCLLILDVKLSRFADMWICGTLASKLLEAGGICAHTRCSCWLLSCTRQIGCSSVYAGICVGLLPGTAAQGLKAAIIISSWRAAVPSA